MKYWTKDGDEEYYEFSELVAKRSYNDIEYDFLITPRVKEEARKYFDCDDIPGAPLEN
jgi:hypothetical protein